MTEFLKFFSKKVKDYPMHLAIDYNKTMDWSIGVWKKGCGENGEDIDIAMVNDGDMELAFAKAYVELKEWLMENEGGY